MNTHDIIRDVAMSRWFNGAGPFSCRITLENPKLVVVTGPNMSGKSFLRKVLFAFHKKAGIEYMHTSQEGRCRGGIIRAVIYGNEEDESTGCNSVHTMLKAIKSAKGRNKPVAIMFDEPEIGCGEEVQAAIGERLANELDAIPQLSAMFIVTHSRHVVRPLLKLSPTHVDLGQMSLRDWTERAVVPIDSLESLEERGIECWRAVEQMMKKPNA